RRHTILQGDWSSDVCSSDLSPIRPLVVPFPLMRSRNPCPRFWSEESRMRRITIATLCVWSLFASYGCPSNHRQPGTTASRATPYVYVSGYDPTISIFQLDSATGALTKTGTATDGARQNPSYMSISPDKKHLYAINEAEHGEGKVVAFKINL